MLPDWLNLRKEIGRDTLVLFIVILVGISGFILGRLSVGQGVREGGELKVLSGSEAAVLSGASGAVLPPKTTGVSGPIEGGVVASKTGTKYHYPWCAGAQSIKEENKVWFSSVADARAAGYLPASNCKGLE